MSVLLALLLAAACTSRDAGGLPHAALLQRDDLPAGAALPALPLDTAAGAARRQVRFAPDLTIAGSAFWLQRGGATAGDSLVLDPAQGLAWAMYRLEGLGGAVEIESLSVTVSGLTPGQQYYLAFSDYSARRWEFEPRTAEDAASEEQLYPGSFDPQRHISASGFSYIALLSSGAELSIDQLRLKIKGRARSWGFSGDERINAIVARPDGGFCMAGRLGDGRAMVLSCDAEGNPLWARGWRAAEGRPAEICGLSFDVSGDIFCAGSFNAGPERAEDFLLLGLSSEGALLWHKSWGGAGDEAALALESQGNALHVVGYTESYGGGGKDAALLKVGRNGDIIGLRAWGGAGQESFDALVLCVEPHRLFVAGHTTSYGAGGRDALLLGYDNTGAVPWSLLWGSEQDEMLSAVTLDNEDRPRAAGWTESFGAGTRDVLLVAADAELGLSSALCWGGPGDDTARGLLGLEDGGLYLAGSSFSFGAGATDPAGLLLRFDPQLSIAESKLWDGAAREEFSSLALAEVDSGPQPLLLAGTAERVLESSGLHYGAWRTVQGTVSAGLEGSSSVAPAASTIPVGGYGEAEGSFFNLLLSPEPPVLDSGAGESDALALMLHQ